MTPRHPSVPNVIGFAARDAGEIEAAIAGIFIKDSVKNRNAGLG
jgi:hypothetical protein